MTEHQYRQAVQLLAAMIVSWLESPEGKARMDQHRAGGDERDSHGPTASHDATTGL